jgi:hypothetical protein
MMQRPTLWLHYMMRLKRCFGSALLTFFGKDSRSLLWKGKGSPEHHIRDTDILVWCCNGDERSAIASCEWNLPWASRSVAVVDDETASFLTAVYGICRAYC